MFESALFDGDKRSDVFSPRIFSSSAAVCCALLSVCASFRETSMSSFSLRDNSASISRILLCRSRIVALTRGSFIGSSSLAGERLENSVPLGVEPRRLENCVSCAMGEDGPKREKPDEELKAGLLVSSTASMFVMEMTYLL